MEYKRCTSMLHCSSHHLQMQDSSLQKNKTSQMVVQCFLWMKLSSRMVRRSTVLTLQSLPVQAELDCVLWSETTTVNLLWLWSATCITHSAFHTELYDAKRTGHAYQCSHGVNRGGVTAPWSGGHQRTGVDGASYNTISRSRFTNRTWWPGPDTVDRMEIH